MSNSETLIQHTQHAFLVAWGWFAEHLGLIQQLQALSLKQKHYHHWPQTKVLEFLVAILAGLQHLQEISLAAHPLDKDQAVAQAWGQAAEAILAALTDESERMTAATLFRAIGAARDHQASYNAAAVYKETGLDPRMVDSLLARLAERDLILYLSYNRGVTLTVAGELAHMDNLKVIEQRFASRYERFEERLQNMLEYVHLRPGQRCCRSAYLVNYLTGSTSATPCGKCDLCSPTNESLPWRPDLFVSTEPLHIDPRLALLGAVRDHNNIFGRWTIEKMLLGIPQTSYQGQIRRLSPMACSSNHFGELEGTGINADRLRRALDALIEGVYLHIEERHLRKENRMYSAVTLTQKGRDALAGGVELPALHEVSV